MQPDKSIQARWARQDAHLPHFDFANVEDMKWPVEVWRAIEGDKAELIKLLRSERDLSRRTRDAMADWLDGNLTPVKLPRHRVRTESKIGRAWYRYDKAREFIRAKGWHRKDAVRYWPPDRLVKEVARKEGVSASALRERVRRTQRPVADTLEWAKERTSMGAVRRKTARKIRSRKSSKIG